MKQVVAVLFAFLLAVSLLACGNESVLNASQSQQTETSLSTFSADFPADLQQYCAPWTHDVAEAAIADRKIHYYFMSSKGMVMYETETDPYKWGDSTLIVFPSGETMLIDTGMSPYCPVLVENLRRMGVEQLDYLMVSHPHGDHCHGLTKKDSILNYIRVGTVLWNAVEGNSVSDAVRRRCQEFRVPLQVLKMGDTMHFGDATMQVLWPGEDAEGKQHETTEDMNNSSIVAKFEYKSHSSLFVGDLYESGEEQLMDLYSKELDVDLLKIPHHGYETSSSTVFAFKTSPKLAVAMGAYRAPIENRYKSIGSDYLSDRLHGYIHVSSAGDDLTVEHQ